MAANCTVKIRTLVVRDNTAPRIDLLRRHGLQYLSRAGPHERHAVLGGRGSQHHHHALLVDGFAEQAHVRMPVKTTGLARRDTSYPVIW